VPIQNAKNNLNQRLITKSIAQMNVAELQQIGGSWKNTMRKRQLEMAHSDLVKNVMLD
jgi:hypothetical protein